MCRHIYDWNIVNCDVKQPIHSLFHSSINIVIFVRAITVEQSIARYWNLSFKIISSKVHGVIPIHLWNICMLKCVPPGFWHWRKCLVILRSAYFWAGPGNGETIYQAQLIFPSSFEFKNWTIWSPKWGLWKNEDTIKSKTHRCVYVCSCMCTFTKVE